MTAHKFGGHAGDVHLTSSRSVWTAIYVLGAFLLLTAAAAVTAVIKAFRRTAVFDQVTIRPGAGQDVALHIEYQGKHLDHNSTATGILVDMPPQATSTPTSQTGLVVRNGDVGLAVKGAMTHGVQTGPLAAGATAYEATNVVRNNILSVNGTGVVLP